MESLQTIKTRIQSINSTQQITNSMRLVATAKVRKVKDKMANNRPFLEETKRVLKLLGANPFCSSHRFMTENDAKYSAVVVIGGDRGLCGSYNTNIGKKTSELIETVGEAKIITVGVKARDYCRRRFRKMMVHSFTGISENPFYEDAFEVSSLVLDLYNKKEVKKIYVVYTEFFNMLSQTPKAVKLLPLENLVQDKSLENKYIHFEPSDEYILNHIVPFYLTSFIYGAILESSVCEQSARVASMDSAAKNAGKMIESLTLSYNQARQNAITQEIIEIVSGADAVQN